MTTAYRVRLINYQTLGARCWWGEGQTHDEAIAEALRIARRTDPDAYYDAASDTVCFAGGINC